jgi:hypothetical protein
MIDNPRTQSGFDFEEVYTRAFFGKVLALLTGRRDRTHLLSFEEVKEKIRCHDESYVGMQEVPIDAIVGSVGRYKDFDRTFLPLTRESKERWRRVDEAYYRDVVLPPVQLYKVGDVYFVKDGNHRVSVAHERHMAYIDAEVIETRCRGPLTAQIEAEDLEESGARAYFLEWSRLDELRPGQDIRPSAAGGYHDLEEHINVHRYYMGIERKQPVPLWDALTGWYDDVYMPVVRLVREHAILQSLPGRTETDAYLWIMDHLHDLRQRYGDQVAPEEAVNDLMEHQREQEREHHIKTSTREAIFQRIASIFKETSHHD